MDTFRRRLVSFCAVGLAAGKLSLPGLAADRPATRLPDARTFESGDFLWPKKQGAFIPFASGSKNNRREDEEQWEKEKIAYLSKIESRSAATPIEKARAQKIKHMSYLEFRQLYDDDASGQSPTSYGSSLFSHVGHVAILDVDSSGVPSVIEAIVGHGVIRRAYSDWLKGRPGELVWHGRLRDHFASDRKAITAEAVKHLNKPYDFWDFDLENDSGFYCSKLAWMSIHRSLGVAVDDDENAKRFLWFSPKRMLKQPRIQLLHSPGNYAFA